MTLENEKEISLFAARVRLAGLRMVYKAASGHIGGSLSSTDILSVLYVNHMNVRTDDPTWADRDRFVLSKGHCTPALYPTLSYKGFFPEEELSNFRSIEHHMSGHAEMHYVKGVDMSTGSLGQGISAAVGMAVAGKLDGKSYRVYCLLGDGEIEEGQVWEACMSASKYDLDNLCLIVDVNGLQIDGRTEDVMPSEPLDLKFKAFGFNVLKIDGHDLSQIDRAFQKASSVKGVPTVILAKTVKGKGVSFMENDAAWHGKAPDEEKFAIAEKELLDKIDELEGR